MRRWFRADQWWWFRAGAPGVVVVAIWFVASHEWRLLSLMVGLYLLGSTAYLIGYIDGAAGSAQRIGSRLSGVLSFRGAPVGQVQGGTLCFEGTRIPVATILAMLDAGDDDETLLFHYPSLTQLDLDAARWFADRFQVRRRRPRFTLGGEGE